MEDGIITFPDGSTYLAEHIYGARPGGRPDVVVIITNFGIVLHKVNPEERDRFLADIRQAMISTRRPRNATPPAEVDRP